MSFQELAPRFERHVRRGAPDECWAWTGHHNSKGYARITIRRGPPQKTIGASRVAWALARGRDFPADKLACHTCDNPGCVNPAHIWPGTATENAADAVAKGRIKRTSKRWLKKSRQERFKYPFRELEVGEFFDWPRDRATSRGEDRTQKLIATCAWQYAKRNNPTARFTTRLRSETTVRCCRIA